MMATPSTDATNATTEFLRARRQVGGISAPVTYSFDERVFSAQATPADKAAAKLEVDEMLRSRILSSEKPSWNMSTSNYDNMQLTGKCYKRTNVNAERNRTNMYVYNFRAEKLPKKYPTIKPATNRFNTGILEVALRDEYIGESFGDDRMMQGVSKRTEELPNHPNLRDATPWNVSVELTPSVRAQHFARIEAERQTNSTKWKQTVGAKSNYRSPEQLAKEAEEKIRVQKEAAIAQAQAQARAEQLAATKFLPSARRREQLNSSR